MDQGYLLGGSPTAESGHGPVRERKGHMEVATTGSRLAGVVPDDSPRRNRLRAMTGKIRTDRRPAKTSAAAVTGVIWPSSTPFWVAVTIRGGGGACSKPTGTDAPPLR